MVNASMVYPMAALVGFTLLFSVFMIWTRIQEIKNGNVKATYFKTYDDGVPSRLVVKVNRHYTNLFELPVIYYATCIVTMVLGFESSFSVGCAWTFVVARVIHAYIHVGPNKIYPRMLSFLLGWLAIIGMWVQILRLL